MRFIKIINEKKFTLISIFLFIYLSLNLLDGERGLISFYKNHNMLNNLTEEKELLIKRLNLIEKENKLLTGIVDTDYLEMLYRKMFLVGKKNEKIYIE